MDASWPGQVCARLAGRKLLLGLSGGLDSTVLLHVIACHPSFAGQLRALHVHHGLQSDADAWAAHCRRLCERLGVELIVERVCVATGEGGGLEAAARDARYAAFARHLGADEDLVLAHHRDDQAETVLLRLLRASSSLGVAAMREQRPFEAQTLHRPLLDIPRSWLRAYASAKQLEWIEDPSNQSTTHDRNFLRHEVIPAIERRWPNAVAALAASASRLAADADLLRDHATELLLPIIDNANASVSVAGLRAVDPGWRAHVLRQWVRRGGFPALPASALRVIETEILPASPDGCPEYRWSGTVLRRWRDRLYLDATLPQLPLIAWEGLWNGQAPVTLPDQSCLLFVDAMTGDPVPLPDADAIAPLTIRSRMGGERIRLRGRQHSHSLKHCLQQAHVPPWLRPRLPLLFASDASLLAAGDMLQAGRLLDHCNEHGVRLRWRQHTVMRAD